MRRAWALAACASALAAAAAAQFPAPPNRAATVRYDPAAAGGRIEFDYNGRAILRGRLSRPARVTEEVGAGRRGAISEKIRITARGPAPVDARRAAPLTLRAVLVGSPEAFAAETYGAAQRRFALIRTSSGPDDNLRNHAFYDRRYDWVLEGPPQSLLTPRSTTPRHVRFSLTARGATLLFVFHPRYYQKVRGLVWFRPWTYAVWRPPVEGWSSWWAYRDAVTEPEVRAIARLFAAKLRAYGFSYIQLDDGYRPRDGYPAQWTSTNAKFPSGLAGLAQFERRLGLKPAIWQNVGIDDTALAAAHPGWFLPAPDGRPLRARWVDYALDGANPDALNHVIRPAFRQLHDWGYDYVKVDTLRHLLYDASYPDRAWLAQHGSSPELAFRRLLGAIRQELGSRTYLLACWGVLPETIGLANASRLGTDGFGPATLQQYNSWNNVVWRNDPDHANIGGAGQSVIRPVLTSMAGVQLLLSDPVEVYERPGELTGARRSSPILFTLPGQLYDYDPTAANNLRDGLRNTDGGTNPGPIDAEREGAVCPWWLMDIARPFERWSVLARLSWSGPLRAAPVRFRDLGLPTPPHRRYLVYEFWTRRLLGVFRGGFTAPPQPAQTARVYAIRRLLDRPQIVSTNRHITQGGVDLLQETWSAAGQRLSGRSAVIAGDRYRIVLHLPPGWRVTGARLAGRAAPVRAAHGVVTAAITPTQTGTIAWSFRFTRRP
jgi:hypothetical protein